MNHPEDYEYSGRQSHYPPILQLPGCFGLCPGSIWLRFDRLDEFSRSKPLFPLLVQSCVRNAIVSTPSA